jgi:serine/threonine-protein kinase
MFSLSGACHLEAQAMTAAGVIRICDELEWALRNGKPERGDETLTWIEPPHSEEPTTITPGEQGPDGDLEDIDRFRECAPRVVALMGRIVAENDREAPGAEDTCESKGQIVGRYELLNEIGRGSEGIVYLARELSPSAREVAVKLIGAGAFASAEAARRFRAEIRRFAGLDHPNIVRYLDSGEDRGQFYYAMSYMHSGTLSDELKGRHARREPLGPDEAARLLEAIARAVDYLHSQEPPILHCDLKPGNILLDKTGVPRVGDFGLATLLDRDGRVTEELRGGTPHYMAPEVYDDRFGDVGCRSDIYTLGVIFYELLAGRRPCPDGMNVRLFTLEREPMRPRQHRPAIPDQLERICLKCLRKHERDRYESAGQLADELERFRADDELLCTPPETWWQRLREWVGREPALAVRLAIIVFCTIIIWGYPVVMGELATLTADHWIRETWITSIFQSDAALNLLLITLNQVTLTAWGLACWAFQRQLNRRGEMGGIQFGWRVADVATLALVILLDDALMSPLTVFFAVLIVASGFWADPRQVLQSTGLSVAAYVALLATHGAIHGGFYRPYRHFHFIVGLSALGLMVAFQARRTRGLIRLRGTDIRRQQATRPG